MINVWIPNQPEFEKYKQECKKLYEKLQERISDTSSFDYICQNTFFYLFEYNGDLIGGIYYFIKDDGNLYLNAFAKRKRHKLCMECLKMSLEWFRGSIYAEAQNRASALCLLKCGFKREWGNLFVKNNFL